jgi:signal transduction histidine kinase/ligand-binding sensor domain-containing protein
MRLVRWCPALCALALALLEASVPGAERTTHVRVYRAAGSYPANVTVSPSGSVLSRSTDSPNVLILDGYSRREVTMPSESTFRVYQSRSAQLWTLTREGLQLFHGDQWAFHPIEEIRTEFASNPLRQLRQISLLPAEVNHILILLSDRLLDYDATTRQVRLLREAKNTRLGEFSDIQEGADEAIWISGTFGFAHVQGPARRITPQTLWGEFLLPETNAVNTLQRPFEFPRGRVTASASAFGVDGSRAIVQLNGTEFSWLPVAEEKIKQAWGAWDDSIWSYSFTTLLRAEPGPPPLFRKESVSGVQHDMAQETNGVFWIASSEGLIRHAPFLWRAPPALEDLQSAIHSIVFDRETGITWCAGAEGLVALEGRKRNVFPWPDLIENLAPSRDSIFRSQDGRILIGAQGRPLLFDPDTRQFSVVPVAPDVRVRLLGELQEGSICAWFETGATNSNVDLRAFDGLEFKPVPLPAFTTRGAELLCVRETARGDLWLGTSTGVILVRPSAGTVEFHGKEQGLASDRVSTLADAGEGRIWCGTTSRAYEYNGQRWEVRLNTPDRVNSIIPALGSLWVGTPLGVYRLLKDSWILHSANEGLPGGGVHTLKLSPSDQLWAGTSGGLVRFHPDADPDPPRTLPPVVQDSPAPSTLEPTIISFRGHDKWDYTMPHELLFAYRLDEGAWTPYSNLTSRTFNNLSSGAHVLEVRAMDRNGNEAAAPSEIGFAVIVPWFQDPRLLAVSIFAGCVTLILAGYAINKHLQLKRSYAEVEKIVTQRTRELERANEELLHSQKMRAIGTMAAGIAHDFNNILSIIKGSAQIIESHITDKDKIKTRINRIQTVVEQGTTIVKALLGLGRGSEKNLKACDIDALLHETRKLLSDRFPESVQIHVDVPPDLPPVVCSPEVLQQMLLNFILNAAEAMANEGLVTLSAAPIRELPPDLVLEPDKASGYIVITASDEGGGIPEESLPRIFEPFFTTKAFSSRRGTGLGLSMVYELAKGLGYGLSVESELGKGSSFSIFLAMNPAESGEGALFSQKD